MIFLSLGHGQPTSHGPSSGAAADVDGDGELDQERDLARQYLAACVRRLAQYAIPCQPLDSGTYAERWAVAILWARANPAARVIYCDCHLNAGGGDRGEVFYDHRSPTGCFSAIRVAHHLAKAILTEAYNRPTSPGCRAHGPIAGILHGPENLCGILVEPYFLDGPRASSLLSPSGLVAIGMALGDGLADALRG